MVWWFGLLILAPSVFQDFSEGGEDIDEGNNEEETGR